MKNSFYWVRVFFVWLRCINTKFRYLVFRFLIFTNSFLDPSRDVMAQVRVLHDLIMGGICVIAGVVFMLIYQGVSGKSFANRGDSLSYLELV